ncbi:hypothetical protein DPEC_G00278800 [Dallia pectoralis]|uniref:Uncharacterized protein n=1 Tax=Dallia pectoralis TaxID=75939 RepID=A0ACC2FMD0_DALPE|nr:hypothetical protein DPEC_G00278800 [Dallia pectoralis]
MTREIGSCPPIHLEDRFQDSTKICRSWENSHIRFQVPVAVRLSLISGRHRELRGTGLFPGGSQFSRGVGIIRHIKAPDSPLQYRSGPGGAGVMGGQHSRFFVAPEAPVRKSRNYIGRLAPKECSQDMTGQTPRAAPCRRRAT